MSGCIDQMKDIIIAVFGVIFELYDVELDRDPSFSFQIE